MSTDLAQVLQKSKQKNTMIGLHQKDIMTVFNAFKDNIRDALPKYITPERFIQILTTVVNRNPAIKECTPESIIGAAMTSSILGFKPVSSLGECYFVPFYNKEKRQKEIQFIVGYKGFIKLAFRNKLIKDVYAEAVHEGDEFAYELGSNKRIQHIPAMTQTMRDESTLKYVYAVAHYTTGGMNFVVLNKAEVDSYRMRSPSQKSKEKSTFVWATDYVAMAKKTAIRRLMAYIPLDDELSQTGTEADGAVIEASNYQAGQLIAPKPAESFDITLLAGSDTDAINVDTGEVKPVKKVRQSKKPVLAPEPPSPTPEPESEISNEEEFKKQLEYEAKVEKARELERKAKEDAELEAGMPEDSAFDDIFEQSKQA